jgi:hypothetical protein
LHIHLPEAVFSDLTQLRLFMLEGFVPWVEAKGRAYKEAAKKPKKRAKFTSFSTNLLARCLLSPRTQNGRTILFCICDATVYAKNKLFRYPYCAKPDKGNWLKPLLCTDAVSFGVGELTSATVRTPLITEQQWRKRVLFHACPNNATMEQAGRVWDTNRLTLRDEGAVGIDTRTNSSKPRSSTNNSSSSSSESQPRAGRVHEEASPEVAQKLTEAAKRLGPKYQIRAISGIGAALTHDGPRPCLLSKGATHKSNNAYLMYSVFTGIVTYRCYSALCKGMWVEIPGEKEAENVTEIKQEEEEVRPTKRVKTEQ